MLYINKFTINNNINVAQPQVTGDVENQEICNSLGTRTHDHTHDRRSPYTN